MRLLSKLITIKQAQKLTLEADKKEWLTSEEQAIKEWNKIKFKIFSKIKERAKTGNRNIIIPVVPVLSHLPSRILCQDMPGYQCLIEDCEGRLRLLIDWSIS